ncbi:MULTISPECIES: DedA family protein [unclassified Ectothiorhodospira]|uniref:DedA family protein n=1 Tax=unclassified Ectothiorhodospira TaxID=2684909 RepID=UPI001EE824FE|nr:MULTISPECIES: DedA family protein [unclassified Ectothiorhodospira]MCG5517061.1 DedA family protein [Ectothiorhodospira sp. 9100]MCG5517745.1 DedA family protein [Ectothiorhodospira sp. 9905]
MDMVELAMDAISDYGYWALGVSLVLLAPEALMPFAGFLAHEGLLNLWLSILAGSLGGTLGSALIYLLARRAGEGRMRDLVRRHGRWVLVRESDLDRVLGVYARRGDWVVAGGRMIPTVRSLVSIPAGLLPMPWGRFLGLTFLGTFAWNSFLGGAGYALGAQWSALKPYLGVYGALMMAIVLLVLGIFVIRRLLEQGIKGQ